MATQRYEPPIERQQTPARLREQPQSYNASGAGVDKPLPSSPDAEAGLLGSILIDPAAMDVAADILAGPTDFHSAELRAVYQAMLYLWQHGMDIDLITLTDRLDETRALSAAGSDLPPASFVSGLANSVPTSAHAEYYALIVRQKAQRRADIQYALGLAYDAYHEADEEAYLVSRGATLDALSVNATGGPGSDLRILTDEEAEALPPLRGILGNILFDESVSYLYGPSGRWKSFLALDWALCVATGRAWLGRATQEGDVLYVCSEGARGIGKRITAWKRHHQWSGPTRLRVMPLAIDLTNAAQVAALPRRLDALDLRPTLIVFDTLAASNTGDENTAENAARITAAARRIIRAHEGVCVLIVHHTGYDNTHMRGSTAFYANADTVIRIEGGDANRRIEPGEPIKVVSDKPKEGEPFADISLTTEHVTWATDEGVIYSSLVIIPGEEAQAAKSFAASLTPQRKAALAVLEGAGPTGLSATAWSKASGMSHGAFFDAIKTFTKAELITVNPDGNYVCTPRSLPAGPVVRSGPVSVRAD